MSKGKQRPPQYSRQSKGYQQNLYKQQLKEKNIEMPKPFDIDKFNKLNRILMVIWVIVTVFLWWKFGWKIGLVCLLIAGIYVGAFTYYLSAYMKKAIKAYKQMGMPKDLYIKQLRKSGTDVKNIERMARTWDKVKVDE